MKTKKIFCILLATVIFAMTLVSCGENGKNSEPAMPTSGKCGDTVNWSFDEKSGLLTVNGTGEMFGFNTDDAAPPWHEFADKIKTVKIQKGVTMIGQSAFAECKALTAVEIPEGVVTISSSAFAECSSLVSVVIPASVTTIGDSAFINCTSLEDVDLKNNKVKLGKYTFDGCSKLVSGDVKLKNN